MCLWGDAHASSCYVTQTLRESPPARLRIDLNGADLVLGDSTLGLGQVNGTLLPLRASTSQMEIFANMSVKLDATVGGVSGKDLGADVMLHLVVNGAAFEAAINAMLDKDSFAQVPEYNRIYPSCLIAAITTLELWDIQANFTMNTASLQLLNGLYPGQQSSKMLSGAIDVLTTALGTVIGVGGSTVAPLLQGALRRYALSYGTKYLKSWTAAEQSRKAECPAPLEQQTFPNSEQRMIDPDFAQKCNYRAAAVGGLGLLLGGFATVVACRRRRKLARSQPLLPASMAGSATGIQAAESIRSTASSAAGCRRCFVAPLCMSKSVPWSMGLAVPLVICSLLLFLLGSNFMQLAETFVSLREAETDEVNPIMDELVGREYDGITRVYQLTVYSLFFSVKMLQDNGMPSLATVVFIFSGILPYTKLLLMLVSWLLPLPKSLRGAILLIMDQIGKYSLVDIFVIQFISCALAITMKVHTGRENGIEPSIVMRTKQTSGFLAFILATVGSLLIGHCCLHYHKKDHITSISDRVRPLTCSGSCKKTCHWLISAQLLFLAMAFTVGGFLPAFTIQMETPFMELSNSTFSFFGFVVALPHFAEEPSSIVTRFGQIVCLVFGIFTIYGHLLLLLLFQFARTSNKGLQTAATFARTLAAWSSLDVVVLSMVLTLVELQNADILHLDSSTQQFLRRLLHHPVPQNGIKVNLELRLGTYVLALVAVLHWLVRPQVMGPLERAVEEAIAAEELLQPAPETPRCDDALGREGDEHSIGSS